MTTQIVQNIHQNIIRSVYRVTRKVISNTQNGTDMNELEQDKRYVFGDMIIVATTDFDFNPILKISTDAGNVVVMPSSDNKIIVKSTVDK